MALSTPTSWLSRGLIAGSLLGLTENLFTAASARNLPLVYLAGSALVSLVVAVAVAFVVHLMGGRVLRERDFPDAFVAIGGGTFCVWFLEKAVTFSKARAVPTEIAILALTTLVGVSVVISVALSRRLTRTTSPARSFTLAMAAFYLWMVGGRYLTKASAGTYASESGVVVNVVLLIAFVGALIAIDRFELAPRVSTRWLVRTCLLGSVVGSLASWRLQMESPIPLPVRERADAVEARTNVVLITVDTLRSDRVSALGYSRETTPHLERLARTSLVFHRAVSPSTWTFPGHLAILTGKLPRRLGPAADRHDPNTDPNGFPKRLPESVDTLAEILSESGYETAAFVSNSAYLARRWGFDQGFGLYDDRGFRAVGYEPGINALLRLSPVVFDALTKPYRPAERLNQTIFRWLDSRGSDPFCLFVNYMEPHEPYAPPAPYDRMFDGRDFFVRSPAEAVLGGTRSVSAEQKRHFDAVYDGEVAYLDAAIGSLLDRLVKLGLFDDSLIIVTSDHGEFLGEHDLWGHGYGPYDPVHRVPLIVKLPRAREQRIVKRWVQTTDILPTVLRELSIALPDGIDGRALPYGDHPVVIEQPPNRILSKHGERFLVSYQGIYDGPWKLIAFSDGSKELYNVDDDPLETTNLISEQPELAAKLMVALTRYLDSIPQDWESVEPAVVDDDALDQLRALGYLR